MREFNQNTLLWEDVPEGTKRSRKIFIEKIVFCLHEEGDWNACSPDCWNLEQWGEEGKKIPVCNITSGAPVRELKKKYGKLQRSDICLAMLGEESTPDGDGHIVDTSNLER
jgi:hypothetical protein